MDTIIINVTEIVDFVTIDVTETIDEVTINVSELGTQGVPGEGVPAGGSAGQVLAKIDGTNFNTEWVTTISVGTVAPVGPSVNDLWVDTN